MKIGTLLKKLRKERGFSEKELARMIGMTDAHINLLENDRRTPSLLTLVKLAAALDVAPADFFSDCPRSDASIAEARDQIIKAKQEIPLYNLECFDYYTSSEGREILTVRFGTKRSVLAGIKLYDDSMLPEFAKNDIVVIDRGWYCRTNRDTGSENLRKKIRSGVYVICSINKERTLYHGPNKLLRKIEIHENGKNITLHPLNTTFEKQVLNIRSDYYDEHNMDVLHILGKVIGKMKFYENPI